MSAVQKCACSVCSPRPIYPDAGGASWPPEGFFGIEREDWPRLFETWEKYRDETERRKIRMRKEQMTCRACREIIPSWRAGQAHQADRHPGKALSFDYTHPRWTFEMMGFADLWDGKPHGSWCTGTPTNPRDVTWEADALLLGSRVASALYWPDEAAS